MDNSNYIYEMKPVVNKAQDAGYVTTGRMVVRYAEDILREMGKNNSTGRYDRVVQGCRSLLGESLLEGDRLKDAVRKEVTRLLKKYNPNDARTVDTRTVDFTGFNPTRYAENLWTWNDVRSPTGIVNYIISTLDGIDRTSKTRQEHNEFIHKNYKRLLDECYRDVKSEAKRIVEEGYRWANSELSNYK